MAQAKLNGLQRQACLAITGAICSTPTAAMEALLGLLPLHIVLEREARWATYRLHQAATSQPQAIVMRGSSMLEGIIAHNILGMPSDIMPKTINLHKSYTVVFPEREQ